MAYLTHRGTVPKYTALQIFETALDENMVQLKLYSSLLFLKSLFRNALAPIIVNEDNVAEIFYETTMSIKLENLKQYCIEFFCKRNMVEMYEKAAFQRLPDYLQGVLQRASNELVRRNCKISLQIYSMNNYKETNRQKLKIT
jgi:hypothetical protein